MLSQHLIEQFLSLSTRSGILVNINKSLYGYLRLSYAFIDPITNNTILTRDETNYRGQMPRINELLQKFPGRTRLLPLVADVGFE